MNYERQQFLLRLVEDYVVECVEDDIYTEFITSEEGAWVYETVGHQGLPGLFPRYLKKEPDVLAMSAAKEKTRMLSHVILAKDAEKVPLIGVIQKAIDEGYNKSFGLAVTRDNKIVIHRKAGAIKAEGTHKVFSNYLKDTLVMSFSKEDSTSQPFVMLGDDNAPECVAFIQGDVSCVDDLRKKFVKERKGCGDLLAFIKILDADTEDSINEEVALKIPESTAAVFLFNTGAVVPFQNGNIEEQHPWGASYGAVKPDNGGTEKPGDDFKGKPDDGGFGDMTEDSGKAKEDKAKEAHRPEGVKTAIINKSFLAKIKPELRSRIAENGALLFKDNAEPCVRAPEKVKRADGVLVNISKEECQKWYRDKLDWLPINWGERPIVPVSFLVQAADADLKTLNASTATAAITRPQTGNLPPSQELNDGDVKELEAQRVKIFGVNTEQIGNPDNIMKAEKSVKPIWAILGKAGPMDIFTPWAGRLYVCTERPDLAAHYWGSLQMGLVQQGKMFSERIDKLEKELADAKSALAAGTKEDAGFDSMTA